MTAKIKLNSASGGGSVSIQAPSSSSNDRTLSLPSDGDGVLAKTDSSGNLTVSGNLNTSNINGGQLGNRRITINGAMQVGQRGVVSTTQGYQTVDRYECDFSGTDEAPEQRHISLTTSDTPYSLGLTKAYKITNGNQSSGAGAADYIRIRHRIEAMDMRDCGWNYKSPSSFITISFWVKSSVAQTFYLTFRTYDGTGQYYPIPFAATTSWTKITHSIPGNSNLDFDTNVDLGLELQWALFFGTDYTNNTRTDNAWAQFASGTQTKDQTSTWYTTNDATFELTGVQLEVGSTATSFEFRTFAQEEMLCRRYYQKTPVSSNGALTTYGGRYSTGSGFVMIKHVPPMRAVPALNWTARATSAGFSYANYSGAELTQVLMTSASPYLTGAVLDAEL